MDKIWQIAREALFANKGRSALTMLGIIIGVFSVIVMVGLGSASRAYITAQVQGLGSGVLIVTPGNPKQMTFGPPGLMTAQTLTMDDVKALENIPGALYVSPNAILTTTLKLGNQQVSSTIIGSRPIFQTLRDLKLAKGRFFTDQEGRQAAKVIVLGGKLYADLFGKQPVLDPEVHKVKINNHRFRVVGQLAVQGSGMFGSVDDQAFMPVDTFHQYMVAGKRINSVFMKFPSNEALLGAEEQVKTLLRQRHKIRHDEDDDFKIQTQADLLQTVGAITQVLTFLLAGIASISLLVGGIGIMNIMLVSVTERTREIGIRKAVGAKRKDILLQFLVESGSLSLVGGSLGMALGTLATWGITQATGLPFTLSAVSIVGAFAFSAGVGILFGLYPANKASKLDPVEALRYE